MKFALVDGNKEEATKGTRGLCQICASVLVAKCGEIKVHHWSHKSKRNCDPWWENEGEWHRAWKNEFPINWQEIVHRDERGEKHIADIETETGWVVEFQHSFLAAEERRTRNGFYKKLVWVVDGTRRKTDKKQFQKKLDESTRLPTKIPILHVHFLDECRLLKEWQNSDSLVFFDFQESADANESMLWFLFPSPRSGNAYLSPFSRANFVEFQNSSKFDKLVNETILPIRDELEKMGLRRHVLEAQRRTVPLSGFERYMNNRLSRRRRF
jgi:hypothetical protein